MKTATMARAATAASCSAGGNILSSALPARRVDVVSEKISVDRRECGATHTPVLCVRPKRSSAFAWVASERGIQIRTAKCPGSQDRHLAANAISATANSASAIRMLTPFI